MVGYGVLWVSVQECYGWAAESSLWRNRHTDFYNGCPSLPFSVRMAIVDNKCWRGVGKNKTKTKPPPFIVSCFKSTKSELCRWSRLELDYISRRVRSYQEEKRGLQRLEGNSFYTRFTLPGQPEFWQGLSQLQAQPSRLESKQNKLWIHRCSPEFACIIKAFPSFTKQGWPTNGSLVQHTGWLCLC